MSKIDAYLMPLCRAHTDGDNDRFHSLMLQVSAHLAAKAPGPADEIRALAARAPRGKFIALPSEISNQILATTPTTKLSDMVMGEGLRGRVDRILLEHSQRDRLLLYKLQPMRKLLFAGPPGTGKTMLASALAHELGLPLMRIQLHTTITQYMGESARKLGEIFATICRVQGVYLFDEIDALASARIGFSNESDTGEARRIVNSMLGFLENDDSTSLIIGATNLVDLIDPAMLRRFDEVITFPLPSADVAEQLVRARLIWPVGINWEHVRMAAEGVGHADLVSACMAVSKDALLAGHEKIRTDDLVAAIGARHRAEAS